MNRRSIYRVLLTLVLGLVIAPVSLGQAPKTSDWERLEFSGKTMGPIDYSVIVVVPGDSPAPERLGETIAGSLDTVNRLMSTYIPESDVSRFNRAKAGEWVSVDAETVAVVQRSIEISELSGGAFDMTVGPAVNLWNFGPEKTKFELPSLEDVEAIRELVGYRKVEVQTQPPSLKKVKDGVMIDLSAIAKGYAVDRVARDLRQQGIDNMMVVVGGEVFSLGVNEKGQGWRTGIELPVERKIDIDRVVSLDGMAVATSGDYRNFTMVDGVRYSHTIDPRTCRPVENRMALASVVAEDCMTADGLATAVMVMGSKSGLEFARQNGFEVYTVDRDAERPLDVTLYQRNATKDFPFVETTPGKRQRSTDFGSILRVFLAAAALFGLAIAGMAVGAIFGNKPIQGSCGGLANLKGADGELACGICEKPATDCKERNGQESEADSTVAG